MILRRNGFHWPETIMLLLAAAGVALLAARGRRRAALLLGITALLHLFGNACWLLCLLPALILIAIFDAIDPERKIFRRMPPAISTAQPSDSRPKV